MPDIKVPEIKIPDVKVPDIKVPDVPAFKAPKMPEMPDVKLPEAGAEDSWKQLSTAVPQPTIHCHTYIQNLISHVKFAENIPKIYPKINPKFQIINSTGQTMIQTYHRQK